MGEVGVVAGVVATDGAVAPGREPSWSELWAWAQALGPDPALAEVGDAELERDLRVVAAQVAAATARWLTLVAEFVIRGRWAEQGARTPAEWLSWAVGVSPVTAREQVRVALELRRFPATAQRFAAGRLSYSKVRAITRSGLPELEPRLLALADAAPASHLDRIVAGLRRTGRVREDADPGRGVWPRRTDTEVTITVRLPVDEGRRAMAIIDRLAARTPARVVDPEGSGAERLRDFSLRRADALLDALAVAAEADADTTGQDRTTLVLHADADALVAPDTATSATMIDDGHVAAMSPRVLRRLACDAGVVVVTQDRHGLPIDVGRRRRVTTTAQRRALRLRDGRCRFPGCDVARHLHAHHIRHWAHGGRTDLANLVLLCATHHRFVHDHGWDLHTDGHGRFAFTPPGDTTPKPSALRPPAASAEAPREGAEADPHALQPPHWYGEPLDLHYAVEVLAHTLERLQHPVAA